MAADAGQTLADFVPTTAETQAFKEGHMIDWCRAAALPDKRSTLGIMLPN